MEKFTEAYIESLSSDKRREMIAEYSRVVILLRTTCKHLSVRQSSVAAYCNGCDIQLGWYCPKSPKFYCEYPEVDWDTFVSGFSEAVCIYCGELDERT